MPEKKDKKGKNKTKEDQKGKDKKGMPVPNSNKPYKYNPMPDDEIKKLAEDIYTGLVFTDRHIRDTEDIQRVFTPLIFLDDKLCKRLRNDPPGMIYEYMENAARQSINGMPIFFSFRIASKEDTKKVFDKYNKIVKAVKDA